MAFIDGTAVNVALPALQQSFRATVLDVQWVVESYALFLAALLLVGGSMGDRFGRRLVFCCYFIRSGIDWLRARRKRRSTDHRARGARNRRGAARAGKPRHH